MATFALRNGRALIAFAVLLGVVSALIGVPPKVDANLIALLPKSDPYASALREVHAQEGGVTLLNLAFESDDPAKLDAHLDALTADLAALPTVEFALHEVDPDLAFQIGLLQLAPNEVSELNVRLKAALALGPALNPFVAQRLMAMGPLTEKIAKSKQTSVLGGQTEGRGRIVVRPKGSNLDPVFSEQVVADVDRVLAARTDPAVKLIWFGGAHRNVAEDIRGIRKDLLATTGISFLLVALILSLGMRSWRAVVLVFPPLILANLITLALVRIGVGSINTYTSFGIAIVTGLGIDFGIHLTGRYREERAAGLDVEAAISRAWALTGPPCMTAALTSAAGFLALSVARFRGFNQLGVLLAAGLMLCLLAYLLLLPLLLRALDPAPAAPILKTLSERESRSTYRLTPHFLMVAVLATGVVGATLLPELEIEYDISALRRSGQAYQELSESDQALMRDSFAPVVASYPDRPSLIAAQAKVEALIADGSLPHVKRALSVENVLPSDQAERTKLLAELATLTRHPNFRYLPRPIAEGLMPLRTAEIRELTPESLPKGLTTLVGAAEGRHRLLLLVTGNLWDMRESADLIDELAAQGDLIPRPAGEFLAQGSVFKTLTRDIPLIALLAVILVTALTAIDLRRFGAIVVALGTLTAGLTWAFAGLAAFGVKLTMVNVVGLPILIGIGIDVVIHLLHRLQEEGPGGVRRAISTAGLASTLSTLTTVASFISLLAAGNRGVRSLGLLVSIGLTTVTIVAAILVPLAWSAGWRLAGKAPGQQG